jgi:hypothetical protein
MVAGQALAAIVDQIDTVVTANAMLTQYHRDRRHSLATS